MVSSTQDPIDDANSKDDEQFIEDFLPSREQWSSWKHPLTGLRYDLTLLRAKAMPENDFDACFKLVEHSSAEDYKKSEQGWKPRAKRKEMKLLDLKYILVKREGQIEGFVSLMPTYEDDYPVVYCYEIHLSTDLQGQVDSSLTSHGYELMTSRTGLGSLLMQYLEIIGSKISTVSKIMLTCFKRNQKAMRFYQKLGYSRDEFSPAPKILRNGTIVEPDYEILDHESYPYTVWKLVPTQEGRFPVAKGRGGPFNVSWEVHGEGDIKLVWVMGLGAIKTLKFGHEMGDKYSCLVLDNRGMGESDKPLLRYSTSEMAKDLLEILEHLGWTSKRQLHVIGVSMGGMIAQELGLLIPDRICSLNLISTAAAIENTTTFIENLRNRINMFIPKSLDRSLEDVSKSLFAQAWLDKPDDAELPNSNTPKVILPPSGAYPAFKTNYERWAAQELTKRLDSEAYQRKGFMLQAIAAGWHHKSAAQLKELGDKVGRERIVVLHGTEDRMITVYHGKKLIEMLNPGVGIIREGFGHVFMMEDTKWYNELMEQQIKKTEDMSKE
ncbi:hypothetical protein B7463_g3783, partial [Scytalidium lignicola]